MPASVAASAAPIERLPERHRNTTGRSPCEPDLLRQFGDEVLVVLAVDAVPLDVHHLAAQAGQVRHTDEAPFGVGATSTSTASGLSLSSFQACSGVMSPA